eukprot:663412-Rhodomonas_salina.1
MQILSHKFRLEGSRQCDAQPVALSGKPLSVTVAVLVGLGAGSTRSGKGGTRELIRSLGGCRGTARLRLPLA